MHVLPFSQLPGMNSLFLDFVEQPERVRDLYPSSTIAQQSPLAHRKELCRILERQNESMSNPSAAKLLEELADQKTVAVITGQQVGLLTGPMYTVWKALTALRICAKMKEDGVACVPIFWMATEDHNWHEVMNFALLRSDFELLSYSLKEHFLLSRQPTGSVLTTHDEVRKILIRAFAEVKQSQIKEYYSRGNLAEAFAKTLLWVLKGFPILMVDPSDPELKQLAVPFFDRFFDRCDLLLDLLRKQNDSLQARHYPVQVKTDEGTLPLFYLNGEDRRHVQRTDSYRSLPVEKLSPAALLRPLMQDYLFPTLAYVGGPAEIAYFAQLHPWYKAMEIQQPWLIPRASITLLPVGTRNFLKSRNLSPQELFLKEDILLDALLNSAELVKIKTEIKKLEESVSGHMGHLKATGADIDPTLRKSLDTVERKLNYQFKKIERKSIFAARRKSDLLYQQLRRARNVIYPGEKMQERYLNIFSFSSRLPDLTREVYEKIDTEAKGHQWIDI